MSVRSNLDELIAPALAGVPGTVSARLEGLKSSPAARRVDADALTALVAASELVGEPEFTEVDMGNPAARYRELTVGAVGGEAVRARLILPAGAVDPAPLVVMFHDAGRPIRGWHHMTRFAALGYAVLALDEGAVAVDGVAEALPELAVKALALLRAGLTLDGVDADKVCTWGEGLGGGLAVFAAAALPDRVAKCAACNPFPCEDARIPAHLDAACVADGLRCELLVGCGLMDEVAPAEGQAVLVNRAGGPAQLVVYPKHAHERINAFEDELLRFLRF